MFPFRPTVHIYLEQRTMFLRTLLVWIAFTLLFLLPSMTKLLSSAMINWIDGYSTEIHPGLAVEYINYQDQKNWNEAKTWCETIGGSLAKFDSSSVLDAVVNSFWDTYNRTIFTYDYWIGLAQITAVEYRWLSDCSGLTWLDNYPDPWDIDKRCFRLRKGRQHGVRDDCQHNRAFMCQRYSNNSCVMHKTTPVYYIDTYYASNESLCESLCYNDTYCIAAVYSDQNNCSKLVRNGTGDLYHFYIKNCITAIFNDSNVTPPTDDSEYPKLDCGNLPTTTSSTSTTSTTTTTTTTTSTTTTSTTTLVPDSCSTPVYSNLSDAEILAIAREIARNLTIDVKKTSSYIRRLTSAEDKRTSSTAVGFVGLVFILFPLSVFVLVDIVGLMFLLRRNIFEIWQSWTYNHNVIVLHLDQPGDAFGEHCYA